MGIAKKWKKKVLPKREEQKENFVSFFVKKMKKS